MPGVVSTRMVDKTNHGRRTSSVPVLDAGMSATCILGVCELIPQAADERVTDRLAYCVRYRVRPMTGRSRDHSDCRPARAVEPGTFLHCAGAGHEPTDRRQCEQIRLGGRAEATSTVRPLLIRFHVLVAQTGRQSFRWLNCANFRGPSI